ncbi:MAG TPA: tetratricopeptide repeat protein, partial [Bacteroidia bacterium]|nr:tetratricopeptide repeat protein [Bacteroidia bacterium]
KDPVLSFGILFYFITFALTSNVFILIGATMADRFLFVPSIGFAIAVCWIVLKLTKGESQKFFHRKAMYILLPLSLFYSIRSFTRSSDWENEPTLFTADVDNAPGSARVHSNYGIELKIEALAEPNINLKNQKLDLALKEFQTAVKIDSLDYGSYAAAGEATFLAGRFAESIYWRTKTLQIEPRYVIMYRDLGNSLMQCHKYDSAIVVYQQAVKANSTDTITRIHIGDCYLAKHDTLGAIDFFKQNTVAYPDYIEGWSKLANIYGMHRQIKESTDAFLEIIKRDGNNINAYRMLYKNYGLVGDTVTANKYAQEYYRAGGK